MATEGAPRLSTTRYVPWAAAAATLTLGTLAAIHYARLGLALSHYDARAHLVVARRIFDSLVPGWQQIGAVWLPLPHLLNALPVQVDVLYRTGASAMAISVLSMTLAAWATASLLQRTTGSAVAALCGAALLLANPNVLYLQSTPMTEPLLFGLTLFGVERTSRWIDAGGHGPAHAESLVLAAMCMTRYEAWPILGTILALAAAAALLDGWTPMRVVMALLRLLRYPVIAMVIFVLNSWWTTGQWFVTGGFFVAENDARGQPLVAWRQVREGLLALSGRPLVWTAYASAALVAFAVVRRRVPASLLLVLAPAAAAALPWYAYMKGHPFRVRYDVPLVVAASVVCAAGIGLLPRRVRLVAALVLVAAVVRAHPPLDSTALMIVEAQRDAKNRIGRQAVTMYLEDHYDGTPILMSMGSLAHYMQDLSWHGFAIRNFVHEGNGLLWSSALENGPQGLVTWVAVEERAEGGDAIAQRARERHDYFRGYTRVASGGGVALYRRSERRRAAR